MPPFYIYSESVYFVGVLQRVTSEAEIVYYVSPLLQRAGVPHGFSTRLGGVSIKPFDSLNLGNPGGAEIQDGWERIHENYRRLFTALGLRQKPRCWVHQVHGPDVVVVRQGHEFSNGARADALVSDDPDRVLGVRIADCVPILIASEDGRAVAAVHAGWRGVVGGVIANALRELRRLADTELLAAIGPCIGCAAFEVGAEVLEQFEAAFGVEAPMRRDAGRKGHVDLRRAVELQLLQGGLRAERIDGTDRCTFRDADEFYSHRRERGLTGRMAALIAPRPL